MTGYNLEDEFIARTERNLKIIEDLAIQGEEVYEVTQLINSLLGLLVFPKERWLSKVPAIDRNKLEMDGWPLPEEEISQFGNLQDLLKKMRNAVAHFDIELILGKDEIVGIQFKDSNSRGQETRNLTWSGKFRVDSLRKFLYKLLDQLKTVEPRG